MRPLVVWIGFVFVVCAVALARTTDAEGATDYIELLFVLAVVAATALVAAELVRTLRRRGDRGRGDAPRES